MLFDQLLNTFQVLFKKIFKLSRNKVTNVTLDDEVRDANVHEARDDDDEAEAVTPAPTVVTLITL